MTRPSATQTRRRMTADGSRKRSATTRTPFPMIAATGVTGTAGTRYVRGVFGIVRRRIKTAAVTSKNRKSKHIVGGGGHEHKQNEKHDGGGGLKRADIETRGEQPNEDAARDDRHERRPVQAV